MDKTHSNSAYFYLLPAFTVLFFTAVLPLTMVFNYSFQDSFSGNNFFWVGISWFESLFTSPEFFKSFGLSMAFSISVLLVEIPLGLYIALKMPSKGFLANLYIILMAIPLLTPWLVVGYIWRILLSPQTGLIGATATALGIPYNLDHPAMTWLSLVLMDSWHWTGFVALLCYAGLRAIPQAYYQAGEIDGASAWSVFKYIQLPKLKLVLLIAILLRFMDSFMIYAEAWVVTRGPGPVSTFLSHELVQTALIQFDIGEGGAMAVVYFLVTLTIAWAFFSLIVPRTRATAERGQS